MLEFGWNLDGIQPEFVWDFGRVLVEFGLSLIGIRLNSCWKFVGSLQECSWNSDGILLELGWSLGGLWFDLGWISARMLLTFLWNLIGIWVEFWRGKFARFGLEFDWSSGRFLLKFDGFLMDLGWNFDCAQSLLEFCWSLTRISK